MENTLDLREQLFNDGSKGLAHEIAVPAERITLVRGLLWDLDPQLLGAENGLFPPGSNPRELLARIQPVLERHPLARFAEVRASGTGLHLILWLRPVLELGSADAQFRWSNRIRVVLSSLPADPSQPGITALTRPRDSINGKTGSRVELLRPGEPVEHAAVERYVASVNVAPFRVCAAVLLGNEHMQPCPVCRQEGTRLDVLDHFGMCYGGCGKVSWGRLLDSVYVPGRHSVDSIAPTTDANVPPPPENEKLLRACTKRHIRPLCDI